MPTVSQSFADAEDRLYMIDGSRSMNERFGREKQSKLGVVRQTLMSFCMENWSASYYPWPLRIGVTAYRLLGTPGKTVFEEVIPLNPEPASLELWRLEGLYGRGGAMLRDPLERGLVILKESPRGKRRLVLIGDGGDSGEDPSDVAKGIGKAGIELVTVELGKESSDSMKKIASSSGGRYQLAKDSDEVRKAIL
jgi:von Willebrand factor type A domain